MGPRLSLLAPLAPTVAVSSYIDALEDYKFVELLSDSRFLKTIKALDKHTGYWVIIKLIIKPSTPNYTIQFNGLLELLVKQSSLLVPISNTLTWHKIIETDRAGYLIRQMGKINLYDRLSMRPFLEPIEKLFITFQLLRVVSELHSLNIHHGDLRSENIIVTSSNWVFLTDFAGLIKPVYLPEDNPNQFSFYFDTSDRRVCYIAPERFYHSRNQHHKVVLNFDENGVFKLRHGVTDEMDLFGLGCVIAELWLDGEPTFTLSQLFKFMRGEYTPDLTSIPNKEIIKLIQKLINVNPEERTGAKELLEEFRGSCFPTYFYTFLYEFMEKLNSHEEILPLRSAAITATATTEENRNNYMLSSISDVKLNYIYDSFLEICKNLHLDYSSSKQTLDNKELFPMRVNIPGLPFNFQLRPSKRQGVQGHQSKDKYNSDNGDKDIKNYEKEKEKEKEHVHDDNDDNDEEGDGNVNEPALVILNYVTSLLKSLKFVDSKIKCCELILVLSNHLNDESKLDRSLPFLCTIIDEYIEIKSSSASAAASAFGAASASEVSAKVVCVALQAVTTLVMSCSYITPINVLLFPDYLLPKLQILLNLKVSPESQSMINSCVARCLPYLAMVAKRFWTMSKAFKAGALLGQTAIISPDDVLRSVTTTTTTTTTTMTIPKSQLDQKFKDLALLILTDADAAVKVSLLENILPLCQFFGKEKTNDIVLPHLISYMNDSNVTLRLAFLSAVLSLGSFIGSLTLQQYILPLLIQTVGEGDQLIVLKILEIFNFIVKKKLINAKTEFNALEIYTELLSSSLYLLLHPNEWIRQSLISLIIAISDNLSDADRYCFLYPLIKGYLVYDIFHINWDTLYPSLTRPISKQVFEMTCTWAQSYTSKSLFWQKRMNFSLVQQQQIHQHQVQSRNDKLSKNGGILSFSKNMGKSVYLPKMGTVISYNSGRSKESVPLSSEDKTWLLKLKSIGIDDKSLWKLFVLREYIYRVSRTPSKNLSRFEMTMTTPRNIFLNVVYKTENIGLSSNQKQKQKQDHQELDQEQKREQKQQQKQKQKQKLFLSLLHGESVIHRSEDAISTRSIEHDSHQTLVLPNMERIVASLQTVETNVFGEMESSKGIVAKPSWINNPSVLHKVFHVDENGRVTMCHIKHTYEGNNPFIWNFLQTLPISPTLDNFAEFGKVINSRLKTNVDDIDVPEIFNLNVRRASENVDAFTCLAIAPGNEFFVTGTENGRIAIWDISQLHDLARAKNPSQQLDLTSRITSVTFLHNRFCFVVTTRDGTIRIFRIEANRNKAKKIIKFMKPTLIREVRVDTFISHTKVIGQTLYAIDYQLKINIYDMITMEKESHLLQNPLAYGTVTSFISGEAEKSWILLGTNKGYLSLWDLRFKLLLKSWRVEINDKGDGKISVDNIVLLNIARKSRTNQSTAGGAAGHSRYPNSNSITVVVKSLPDDIETTWEIPSLDCQSVTKKGKSVQYRCRLVEISSEVTLDEIALMLDDLKLNLK